MTTKSLIRANLASVRSELTEALEQLSDDMLDWAPSEGMRTIHGQFVEILGTEQWLVEHVKGLPGRSNTEVEDPFWQIKSVEGLIQRLGEVRQETLACLENLSDDDLNLPVAVSSSWAEYLELEQVPAAEIFRFIGRHESYHSGQIVSYLWARGSNPYQWESA